MCYFGYENECVYSIRKRLNKKGNTGIINENVIIRKWRASDGIKTIRYDKQI